MPYGQWHELAEHLRVRFAEAGHILGSAIVELEINLDGVESRPVTIRKARATDASGVFELQFSEGSVRVKLVREAFNRHFIPRRRSQYLTVLALGEPVRVLLNGRAGWHSGTFYYLHDYHLVLCDDLEGEISLPMRQFDLQADLL